LYPIPAAIGSSLIFLVQLAAILQAL